MKILFLTYYFEPDLCAGSFRNSSLFKEVIKKMKPEDSIEVVTTHPNRYDSYKVSAKSKDFFNNTAVINRIELPNHRNGFLGQIKAFKLFYKNAFFITKNKDYDLVYASSSRLFTAFLGAKIAKKKQAKLYLDIRDIFKETISDLYDNKLFKFVLVKFVGVVESYTFKKANHINLVSEGFKSYFNKYKSCSFSFYTNGIDDVFINSDEKNTYKPNGIKKILYAGNIGQSQGLSNILSNTAKELEGKYEFIVIGDGGDKEKLESTILDKRINNIKIINPIKRGLLIEEYYKADFLFLHLNFHKAFERVLPSKLFEYGAFDKPIIAGVSGYAASFLNKNMSNLILFKPGDYKTLILKLKLYEYKNEKREEFIVKFSRSNINEKMAVSILDL